MDSVLRTAAVYGSLLVIFRLLGRRALSQITTFDFVLLLIISETTQPAMTSNDYSVTNVVLCILTLVTLDVGLSHVKRRWPMLERFVEGMPLVLVADGKPLLDRMRRARVEPDEVLASAREQGIGRMEEIRYAILERSGGISIIPVKKER